MHGCSVADEFFVVVVLLVFLFVSALIVPLFLWHNGGWGLALCFVAVLILIGYFLFLS